MPQLTYQGDIAITLQGPAQGVYQPLVNSTCPTDLNSLDAGVWPQGGNITWASGPRAQNPTWTPAFLQLARFFPTGFSSYAFTDPASAVGNDNGQAIVFQNHLYAVSADAATVKVKFADFPLSATPTNALQTLAAIPFQDSSTDLNPFAVNDVTNTLFAAAYAPGGPGSDSVIVFLRLGGFSIPFLYVYPLGTGFSINSSPIYLGIGVRNSPDFGSGLNYTISTTPGFSLIVWRFTSGSAIQIVNAAANATYDAPLTARGGVIDMKPCVYGWLALSTAVSGPANSDTRFILCSRDLTRYWNLILTPQTAGFGFGGVDRGLQIDSLGNLYLYSSTDNLFKTASSASSLLPLSPSIPALGVNCNNPPPALLDTTYNHTITAAGGIAPYTLALISGGLPPGLTFDPATGIISGTLTHSVLRTPYAFTIQATDSRGVQAQTTCTISVPVGFVPVANIWESGLARGSELSASMIRLAAFDVWARGEGPLALTVYGPDKVLSQTPQLLLASGVPATVLTPNPGIMYAVKLDFRQIENFSILFETNTLDAWLELSGFRAYMKSDLYNR